MARYEKPPAAELRSRLTDAQYEVTQNEGTEAPFRNEYWDNKEHGLYVDVVSGEPLFSSLDKFDSGTGWPSFTRPLEDDGVETRTDYKLLRPRVEVRSRHADSHLGHVFEDGPAPTGLRYCVNSAALRFVPVDRLEDQGYGGHRAAFVEAGIVSAPGARGQAETGGGREAPAGDTAGDGSASVEPGTEVATLAAGCFWGVEQILRGLPGVIDTEVGYSGGHTENPGYTDVVRGDTGHAEAVRVVFDPERIGYDELLRYFFRLHDPTTPNRQGNDVGTQYRSAIFFHDERQKEVAQRVRDEVSRSGRWEAEAEVVTEIVAAGPFHDAEGYHQDYLQNNPHGYTCHYLRD